MSEYNLIYEAIDNILPDTFEKSYGDMNYLDENVCGIFVRDGASEFIRDIANDIIIDSCNIVFNINSSKNITGVIDGNDYCSNIRKKLIRTVNYTYEKDNEVLFIVRIDPIGNVNYIGKNEQGIPTYSINFRLIYKYIEDTQVNWNDTLIWIDTMIWDDIYGPVSN